jgi:hypothetical protein
LLQQSKYEEKRQAEQDTEKLEKAFNDSFMKLLSYDQSFSSLKETFKFNKPLHEKLREETSRLVMKPEGAFSTVCIQVP